MILDIYATHPFWVWAALAAILLGIEILAGSGWLLWPSAAAFVTGLATFARISLPMALLIFAALTIVSTLLARRYVPKSLQTHRHDINDNVSRLIGHRGETVAGFDGRAGRVFIDGKEWAAELEDGDRLAPGARVEVTGVHGARLTVREA